jgi:hypothetical protein
MADLIDDYLNAPDTPKPALEDLMSLSLANIAVPVPEGILHAKSFRCVLKRKHLANAVLPKRCWLFSQWQISYTSPLT